jgi:hypothetical protein
MHVQGNEWDRNTGIDPPAAFMKLLRPDAMVGPSYLTVPQLAAGGNSVLLSIQLDGSQRALHHAQALVTVAGVYDQDLVSLHLGTCL